MKFRLISFLTAVTIIFSSAAAFADGEEAENTAAENTEAVQTADTEQPADTAEVSPAAEEPVPSAPVGVYSDVDASHWAYSAIKALSENQVINGMGDGTFNPDGKVTREQFVKLIVGAYKYGGETDAVLMPPDADPLSWSYSYIRSAIIRGIVKPDSFTDGLFEPKEPVTRGTAVQWLANSLNTQPQKPCPFPDIYDVSVQQAAAIAAEHGLVGGYDDNTFKPGRTLSRAEAAIIIARLTGISEPVPYPEITGTYYDTAIYVQDVRNTWAVDSVYISAQKGNSVITYDTTDAYGEAHLYLPDGEYNVLISHKDYETTSLALRVSGQSSAVTVQLIPIIASEFKNVYPSMSETEKSEFSAAVNSDSLWLTVPEEYDYKTGYSAALSGLLSAAPFISSVRYSDDTNSRTGSGKAVAVKSSAEKVDSYLLRHYALSPQHEAAIPELALSYENGYWYYDQKASATSAGLLAVPEALYTSDNTFYYLKYSMGGSPDTKYAILYKTQLGTYQIVWASKSHMSDELLKAYIAEAKDSFPSCAADSSDTGTVTLTATDPNNGYPIDNVSVTIYSPGFEKKGEGATDANGNISSTLPAGAYNIYLEHPDYAPAWSCFTVSGDCAATVTLNSKK